MKQTTDNRIIHLEFKFGRHHYFGSIKAIYLYFLTDAIGITYNSLRNAMTNTDYYENDKVIVRRRSILRMPHNNSAE